MYLKQKSVKNIIGKIVRDLNLGDKEIPWQDMIEWVIEALQHIGVYIQYTEVYDHELDVEDYRAKLPCNFHQVMANPGLNYKISSDTIITDKREGCIKINYLALPVDEEGFPMVPDNISFDTALFWKVAYQLAIRDELPNKALSIQYCQSRWNWYCGQARSIGNMPDSDQMERIKNNWLRLRPDINQYRSLFNKVDNTFTHG